MENIVAKAKDLYDSLVKKLQEVAVQKERLDKETVAAMQMKNDFSAKKADIEKREAAIAQVESLLEIQASAKVAKKEANEARLELAKEQDNYKAYVKEQNEALSLRKQELDQKELKLNNGYAQYKKDKDALEAEKKDLKAQVMKEIGAKINA